MKKTDYIKQYKELGGTDDISKLTVKEIKNKISEISKDDNKAEIVKIGDCTHIDRSNGVLLREKDLNKEKPWISPISGQATVEKLTERDLD